MIPKILHTLWIGQDGRNDRRKTCIDRMNSVFDTWIMLGDKTRVHDMTPHAKDRWIWCDHNGDDAMDIVNHPSLKKWGAKSIVSALNHVASSEKDETRANALRADVLKICLIYALGGVFVDDDLYWLKPIGDKMRELSPLLCRFRDGVDTAGISEAVIGAEPQHPFFATCLDLVTSSTGRVRMSVAARIHNVFVYDNTFFVPHTRFEDNAKYYTTRNTHAIHLWRDMEYSFDTLQALAERTDMLDSRAGNHAHPTD